jgi:site-specific DNA-methyltransferase (adenine-specific)/adenine-specific DNA-methyltransferase
MPSLNWIGKKAVENHHREVPFHLLKDVPELSVGEPGTGNLLLEGDNLVALKALLPYYAGQVKCIYIDPPYNTGNENWAYNDNVNSPEIREWLGKVVGGELEDLTRHDKWLCMMYPRLALLRHFLREDGAIFISIDDNEMGPLRLIMNDIFGTNNFATTFIWEKRTTRENRRVFSFSHDYVLCYAKNLDAFEKVRGTFPLTDEVKGRYSNLDNDPRGPWQSVSLNAQAGHGTPDQFYTLKTPGGRRLDPPKGRCWTVTQMRLEELIVDNRIWFGESGNNVPRLKKFLSESTKGLTPHTLWRAGEVGTTDTATKSLMDIFGGEAKFDSPKPVPLIERVLRIGTAPGDLVLDSFAGSGTTGHAVLRLNKEDGGNRRFILVEMDPNICRHVTVDRLRRVCTGYKGQDGGQIDGLASGFRFCILSDPLFDEQGNITSTVRFAHLARHVYFTETGEPLPKNARSTSPLIGVRNGVAVYLLYNGILKDKSPDGGNVLTTNTLSRLPKHDGPKVVYGTACRIGSERLRRENIVFKQLPYKLRVDAL